MAEKLRLGGMALGNGVLVHGPTSWAAAVRMDDGEVKIASSSTYSQFPANSCLAAMRATTECLRPPAPATTAPGRP